MKRLFRFLGVGRQAVRAEVDEEIEAHIAARIADLERRGMSPEEARAEAYRRFGELDGARRKLYRSARRRNRRIEASDRLGALLGDLRLAARRARSRPGHTALTITVFAIGVGLSTLTFGLVDQILLRPLPFPDPDRLVRLESMAEERNPFPSVSATNWADWRESPVVAETGIWRDAEVTLQLDDRAESLTGTGVAGAFFRTVRPRMRLGRGLTEEETDAMLPVAVVSERFWGMRLGAPSSLEGVTLTLDGTVFAVVGVVREESAFPSGADLWVPTPYRIISGAGRNNINFQSVARLTPGTTVEAARAALQRVADRIRAEEPEGVYSWGVGVTPLREAVAGPVDGQLRLLLWSSFVVLLVACLNLAGLALARGRQREREMAVRTAIGAGRGRLVRQLLTEQLVLGAVGGVVGIALAWLGTDTTVNLLADRLPRAGELTVDWPIAASGIGISLIAVLLAGLWPALRISSVDPADQLTRAVGSDRRGASLPGAGLVVAELVLAVTLLTGSGLLVRSMGQLLSRDLGFEAETVAAATIRLRGDDTADFLRYWEEALAAAEGIPGVQAAVSTSVPVGVETGGSFITVEGVGEEGLGALYSAVSSNYFQVMGIDFVEGRSFGPEDAQGAERVVIVDRGFAERYWPGGSALGKRVRADSHEAWFNGGTAPWLRIVGVVEPVRSSGLEFDAREHMYVHYRQTPWRTGRMAIVARGASSPPVRELQAAVSPIDRSVAVEAEPVGEWIRSSLGERRLLISLLGGFSALTLGLAALGLYGLISHSVGRRRREMALRAALGADRGSIRRLILLQGLRVVVFGLAAGVLVSYWTSSFLDGFLVEVDAFDPLTHAGVIVVLFGVGTLAVLLPSIRATRAQPAEVLRD